MSGQEATQQLAQFTIETRSDDISAVARKAAHRSILDTVACAVAGAGERASRAVRDQVFDESTAAHAAIWGTPARASTSRAAFANGVASHALDFDDVSWAMDGHPSAPLLPAVIAVAEKRRATGADALAAYAVGFEVAARLGQAMARSHYARGWHPTSTMGAIGATAAAARLMGLDVAATRTAFGIAASQLAGTRMNFGTDTKPLHAGLAAQAGVLSAQLASRGLTARGDAVEGAMGIADLYAGEPPITLPTLGAPWALVDPGVELKPYPSCRFTHRAIDAILTLRAGAPSGAIPEAIACEADPFSRNILIYERATTGLEGKFCMAYCLAVAWLDGHPRLGSFTDARAAADDVQSLAARVRVIDTPGADEVVSVELGGETRVARVRHPLGSPANPLTSAQLRDKAERCMSPSLGADAAAEVVSVIEQFHALPDLDDLIELLTPPG